MVSPPSTVSVCPSPALAGQVVWTQSCGPSCCSCVLSSQGGSLVWHSVALASSRTLSCSGLRLTVPTVWWSKLLEFSWTLCWGSFLSLPVFADSSGWLSDNPWLSALRCLTVGGVTLVFWVPRSCGVHGLHDGVTCLRSGLWSSSARDRNEDFPSFW